MVFVLTNGLIAGMILATFFALCDSLFGTSVFDVLIDVSYLPGLENLPSVVELLIHLLISIVIAFALIYFYPRVRGRKTAKYLLYWLAAFTLLYLPFSFLSGHPVSFGEFLIWVIGHAIYTMFLALQVEKAR